MTRAFVLNHYPVLPARNGGQNTVRAIVRELALAWPTELIWTERKTDTTRVIDEPDRRWTVTVLPNLWRQRKAVRWLRHGIGRIESDFGTMLFCAGNRRLVGHLLDASSDGDIFLLAHPWLWPALRSVLRQRRRAVLVYDAHNVEHVLKQEALRPSPMSRWLIDRTRRMEAELVARADLTLACTPLDAEQLAALAGVPRRGLLVGLRGVDPSPEADAVALARGAREPGRRALFVGSKHLPNDIAARWIIESLAPQLPHWQFDIVGACGPACGAVPRSGNVGVLGPVEDLRPLMARADLGLNPITSGSGINMKLFEYLQHGLPVISTPFGTRGLEGTGCNGVVVAALQDFGARMTELAADVPRQRALAAAGRDCVRQRYTWPAVGQRLRGHLDGLLARQAPA